MTTPSRRNKNRKPPKYTRAHSDEERRERIKANQKKYRDTHRDQIRAYYERTRDATKVRLARYKAENADRFKAYFKERTKRTRKSRQAYWRFRLYGITTEQWDALFILQGKRCAICGTTDPCRKTGAWSSDHDHQTKIFRGILCRLCNVMLGHAKDDPEILAKAIEYLRNPPFRG